MTPEISFLNRSNNQTVNYTYDQLNRQLTEDFAGQAGVEVTYGYDAGTDGIGRQTSSQNAAITQHNTYNALGLLVSEIN